MKKIFPAAIIAICTVFMFASCNKNYTCTCTVLNSGVSHVMSSEIDHTTKGDAQDKCDKAQIQLTDTANHLTASCHI